MQHSDWNTIRDFLAVARTGSLNQASRNLAINPTTVGRHIEALEASLGLALFQRVQTGYVLTDEGRDLIPLAEAIEAAALALEQQAEATQSISGRVRLATAENLANFILLPAVPALRARHPNLLLEIVTDISSVNLHRREADLALRFVRPTQGNVTVKRVGRMHYGLYASNDYLAGQPSADSDAGASLLDTGDFIMWAEAYAHLPAAKWLARTLQGRPPALVLTSLYAQLIAAKEGAGIALLPHFLAQTEPSLQHVPSEADTLSQDIWLVLHADLASSARIRAAADFAETAVRSRLRDLQGAFL